MKQSRIMSLMETVLSTTIGFVVALVTQWLVFPLFGFRPALVENLAITAIFTVVSILRQFFVRRAFEALHIRRPLSPAMQAVIAERYRQIDVEGYSPEHDDLQNPIGSMSDAGACYIREAGSVSREPPSAWPWADAHWKPKGYRRNLVRGAALAVAEIEKFDRNKRRPEKLRRVA